MIATIVAVDNDYGIGFDNQLLEHIPEDLKRFKMLTTGNVVVMGTNTWRSLPKRPLPDRYNMVVTRNPFAYLVSNNEYDFYSWDDVKSYLNHTNDDVFIIGGERVYKELLPYCEKVYLTKIFKSHDKVDVYFPNIEETDEWELVDSSPIGEHNGIDYQFQLFRRV